MSDVNLAMIPVRRLNHAVLYVRDAQRAAEFYERVFGFERVADELGGRAVFLRSPIGGNHHDLGLFTVGAEAPGPERGRVGLYHLAWEVDSVEALATARDVLAREGAFGGESSHGVSLSLYGHDPDGNEFEIMWSVPEEDWGEAATRGMIAPLDLDAAVKKYAGT